MSPQQTYFECIKLSSNNQNLIFNKQLKIFNICYETCKTCYDTGNPSSHKCLICDVEHHFVPGINPKDNCVTECKYYYYFTYFDQYKCTIYPQCPEEAKYLIQDKNKCVDDCIKDNDYKYMYNGNCVKECPEGTVNENYICVVDNNSECTVSETELGNINLDNTENVEKIVKIYLEEYDNTNKHISQYKNND